METRVLTLFDDEEFFPKEPPKEKPKKEKATKAAANTVSEESDTDKNEDEIVSQEMKLQDLGPSIFEEEDIPAIASESERLVDDKIPESEFIAAYDTAPGNDDLQTDSQPENDIQERLVDDKVPENESVIAYYATAGNEEDQSIPESDNTAVTHAETSEETPQIINEPETTQETIKEVSEGVDKELNQQILSELIQLDYTALMQKNYAFDLNNATVINKELPKETTTPVAENNDDEDIVEDEVFEEVAPLPEWNLDKKYYTIGEVAQLFAVNTSHIRFWTNEFKLKPRTTRKGDRLYSPKDIAELRLIHHLVKEKKHTIKGAREKLKAEKTGVNNKLDLKESLLELKNTLLKIREQL
ncbi:MerR family transcriptional regulator [Taibaiella lutea]|nr:MerR family transcriptional regulator [Taibaiella lutea]